jgi:hypothetical protein
MAEESMGRKNNGEFIELMEWLPMGADAITTFGWLSTILSEL